MGYKELGKKGKLMSNILGKLKTQQDRKAIARTKENKECKISNS